MQQYGNNIEKTHSLYHVPIDKQRLSVTISRYTVVLIKNNMGFHHKNVVGIDINGYSILLCRDKLS